MGSGLRKSLYSNNCTSNRRLSQPERKRFRDAPPPKKKKPQKHPVMNFVDTRKLLPSRNSQNRCSNSRRSHFLTHQNLPQKFSQHLWQKPQGDPRFSKNQTYLTASGQILSPPLEVQMLCSRTGVPVCAAFTIHPARMKMPTWATELAQSPPVAQKIMSPAWAWERGKCLPRLEWYWVWAVRGMVKPLALQTEYCVSPENRGRVGTKLLDIFKEGR